jgi:FAD/FMN-containing dehydrogenase
VRPGSTQEVAQVVRLCAEHGTPLVPQGATPGSWAAACPTAPAARWCCRLQRMNRIRAIDPANLTMTVDAGCVQQHQP